MGTTETTQTTGAAGSTDSTDSTGDGKSRRVDSRAKLKAETRRRLLEAATEVFIEEGPTTASLEEIAARAGVSRPTLLFHFRNRHNLMDQVAAYQLDRYSELGHEYHPGELRPFLEAFLTEQRNPVFRLVWQLGDIVHPAGLPHHVPEHPNRAYHDLIAQLEERIRAGGVDGGAAHERAVLLTPGLMMVGRRFGQELATEAEVKEFVEIACRFALAT